jgi:hypothetical protein
MEVLGGTAGSLGNIGIMCILSWLWGEWVVGWVGGLVMGMCEDR